MTLSLVKTLADFNPAMQLSYYVGKAQQELLSEKTSLKIYVPSLGCYMSEPLAYGNEKIKGTLIFDTMAGPDQSAALALIVCNVSIPAVMQSEIKICGLQYCSSAA